MHRGMIFESVCKRSLFMRTLFVNLRMCAKTCVNNHSSAPCCRAKRRLEPCVGRDVDKNVLMALRVARAECADSAERLLHVLHEHDVSTPLQLTIAIEACAEEMCLAVRALECELTDAFESQQCDQSNAVLDSSSDDHRLL